MDVKLQGKKNLHGFNNASYASKRNNHHLQKASVEDEYIEIISTRPETIRTF